ncbi:MAG: hypothetical protein RBS87_06285 [Acholeplasma sp.]|jgi:hypothetical protein|nr:hypothetical protein [Acholeplasma sp.]
MIVIKGVIYIRKLLLIIPLLLVILMGCTTSSDLKAPSDFRFEDGFLYWTEVKGAEHYVIEINGINQLAYNNKFDLEDFNTGNYTACIATFSKGKLSPFTNLIQFKLIQNEELSNLTITGTEISWDAMEGLTYQVSIKNVETRETFVQNLLQNMYNYESLEDGLYDIEIKVVLDEIVVTSKSIRFEIGSFDYVIEAGMVLDIETPDNIFAGETPLVLDEDYTVDEYGLIIDSEKIDALTNHFVLTTTKDDITVYRYVRLVTIDIPAIVSSGSTTYTGVDMVFTFDLKGGSFQGLGGNDIAFDDYDFTNNTLTIYASYIDEIIQEDVNRQMLILTYVLQNDPHVVIGYLFITLP